MSKLIKELEELANKTVEEIIARDFLITNETNQPLKSLTSDNILNLMNDE